MLIWQDSDRDFLVAGKFWPATFKLGVAFFEYRYQYIDMLCPYCGSTQISVINSRPTKNNSQTWRRKHCTDCGSTFTTYERIDLRHLIVIKKSGKRQRYNRAKLYSAIYHSFLDKKNLDRGRASELTEEVANKIEEEILKFRKKRISSGEISELILGILRKKAPDSFLRFLAYREGNDLKKMERLLKKFGN